MTSLARDLCIICMFSWWARTAQHPRKDGIVGAFLLSKLSQFDFRHSALGGLRRELVKQFGQRMVQDHSKANDELKRAAAKVNIALPTDLDVKDQATYDALSKLSGSAFDKAYARDMVKDHEMDIAEFNREAANGQKDLIKDFASQTLPTLKEHLMQAHKMRQTVSGLSSTTKKNSSGSRR